MSLFEVSMRVCHLVVNGDKKRDSCWFMICVNVNYGKNIYSVGEAVNEVCTSVLFLE